MFRLILEKTFISSRKKIELVSFFFKYYCRIVELTPVNIFSSFEVSRDIVFQYSQSLI